MLCSILQQSPLPPKRQQTNKQQNYSIYIGMSTLTVYITSVHNILVVFLWMWPWHMYKCLSQDSCSACLQTLIVHTLRSVTLIVAHLCGIRTVNWELEIIQTQTVDVGVMVGEQTPLKKRQNK